MPKIPTGVEIIQKHNLKDQIMIEIPNSRYHLHGLKQKNKKWNISIINQEGGCKRNIIENVNTEEFAYLIAYALSGKDQTEFKQEPRISDLRRHYKSLIKSHQA